jgi:hypothetical protein
MRKPVKKTYCTAIKPDGTHCKAHALMGSRFCFFHDPAKAAARDKAQSRGGHANAMATLNPDAQDVRVEDSADVVNLLGQTINQVRRGEIDPRVANAIGYLSNIVLAATSQCELERRIAGLESLVRHRGQADGSIIEEC